MTDREKDELAREQREHEIQCVGMMRAAVSIIERAGPKDRALFDVWYNALTAAQKATAAMWNATTRSPSTSTGEST